MTVLRSETVPLQSSDDVVIIRQHARTISARIGLKLTDQTKIITAASELARNTVTYGGGGTVLFEEVEQDGRRGVRMTFEDQGPGIPDLNRAMENGYTTGNGMGLGLPGSKRLVDEFDLWSEVGVGTRVSILRWK